MNWNFKDYNNYRARVLKRETQEKFVIERFSNTQYSRYRVLKSEKPLNFYNSPDNDLLQINMLKPKSNTKKSKSKPVLTEEQKIAQILEKNMKSIQKVQDQENEELSNSYKHLNMDNNQEFDNLLKNKEEIESVNNQEEDSEDLFGFLDNLTNKTNETEETNKIKSENELPLDNLQFFEDDESVDDILSSLNLDIQNTSNLPTNNQEDTQKQSVDIQKQKNLVVQNETNNKHLLDSILELTDGVPEIINPDYINNKSYIQDLQLIYDKKETFQGKGKAEDLLLQEEEFGDRILSINLSNIVKEAMSSSASDYSILKDVPLWEKQMVTTDSAEITMLEYSYQHKGEIVEVQEIKNIEGSVISKIWTSKDYTVRIDLNMRINDFLYRTELIPKTPYVKTVKPNPYKVRAHIGKGHKSIQFPTMEYFSRFLNLVDLSKKDYRIIRTKKELIEIADEINNLPLDHIIAYDAETTGLKFKRWLTPETGLDHLVTHSFSWKDNQSVIIPVRMKQGENIDPTTFKKYFKNIMETRRILCHNGSADTLFNMPDGIRLNCVEDTYHLAKHLMPYLRVDEKSGKSLSRSKVTRALDTLVKMMFNIDLIDLKRYVFNPAGMDFDFSILDDDYLIFYGCPDTDMLRLLWKAMRPKLERKQENAYRATIRASCILAEQATYNGIKIDPEVIVEGREKAVRDTEYLEELALQLVGENKETLKISSGTQLANFIYGKYGVPVTQFTKRTSKGSLSADKDVLEQLMRIQSDEPNNLFQEDVLDENGEVYEINGFELTKENLNNAKYPFCAIVRVYSDIRADITANFDRLMKKAIDGVYYPDFRTGATATWRTTEGIQTVKGSLKGGLGVYDPEEYYMLAMDFSTEEVRLAVNQSEDDTFKDILQNPESDAHTSAAAELFFLEEYQVTKPIRAKAKACNFGIIYGMKERTLSESMFRTDHPTEEQIAEAREVYRLYCYKFKKMISALQPAILEVQEKGYIYNDLSYKMIYDDVLDLEDFESQIFDPTRQEPPVVKLDELRYAQYSRGLANKAGNYPIQSWAAGLLMFLIISLDKRLREEGLIDKIVFPMVVHDEIELIVHKSVSPYKMIKIMIEVFELKMTYLGKRTVPLYLGIGFGQSWGDAKSDDVELPVNLQHMLKEEYENGTYPKDIHPKDIKQHFLDRKKEYLRDRLRKHLQFVLDEKEYKTGKVIDALRSNIFILNNSNDIFKYYSIKTDEYDHIKLIETITKGTEITLKDIKIINTKPTEAQAQNADNDPVDFFFEPMIHPLVKLFGDKVILDLTGQNKNVMTNLLTYLKYFDVPADTENAKPLVIKLNQQHIPVEGYHLVGLPLVASDVITHILEGNPPPKKIDNIVQPYQVVDFDTIWYTQQITDGNTITETQQVINVDKMINPNKREVLANVLQLIQPYTSNTNGKPITMIINGENIQHPNKLRGIPMTVLEQIRSTIVS